MRGPGLRLCGVGGEGSAPACGFCLKSCLEKQSLPEEALSPSCGSFALRPLAFTQQEGLRDCSLSAAFLGRALSLS